MSLRDDLIAARALIDTPDKWCKGITDGQNCAMWAVSHVAGVGLRWNDAKSALKKALPRAFPGGACCSVVAFNDHPETTHADVMALFDCAIARAALSESEGQADA